MLTLNQIGLTLLRASLKEIYPWISRWKTPGTIWEFLVESSFFDRRQSFRTLDTSLSLTLGKWLVIPHCFWKEDFWSVLMNTLDGIIVLNISFSTLHVRIDVMFVTVYILINSPCHVK